MFLKNYTSSVPVSDTIHRIEKVLIRCGVSGIAKQYIGTDGRISAITFQIPAATGPLTIRLPANEQAALDALWEDYVDGDKLNAARDQVVGYGTRKQKCKQDFIEQAQRTAWKTIQDWVEVQMSMIQMRQAETLQVFLPYVYDGRKTYYDALKETNYRGLLPETTQENA